VKPHAALRAAALAAALLLPGPAKAAAQDLEPPPVPWGRVPPPGPYAAGFDALHYRVAVEIPDTGAYIRGTTTIDIRLSAPRDTLVLDLTGLRVNAVHAGTSATLSPAAFRQTDGRLRVAVPAGARAGDTLHVRVEYEGTPDDGLLIRPNLHGARSAFADNFPDRGRFWFPSIDHPGDKATVEYEVRVPASWEVVANGRRAGADSDAARPADGVWRWRMEAPIPTYTMVIGAADFAVGTVARCARGGPAVRVDPSVSAWGGLNGDDRRSLVPNLWFNYSREDGGRTRYFNVGPGVNLRASTRFSSWVGASLSWNRQDTQWYGNFTDSVGTRHYTFAHLEQRTASLTWRGDYTFTPDLTLQVYAQPFVSKGTYANVRELSADPRASDYDGRYQPYGDAAVAASPGGFNVKQFNSNVVLRWEYRPGSVLFLVWNQGREGFAGVEGPRSLSQNLGDVFDLRADNTFLVKASYWINW